MTEELLLQDLKQTYVRLLPSGTHGIGVFAIRFIPKGCRNMFTMDRGEWMKIDMKEVSLLPSYSRQLITNYCAFDDQHYYIEKTGFKKMDLVNFINHSNKPNIGTLESGKYFEAITDIKAGQELFIDYRNL